VIGQIGGGKRRTTGWVDVAMLQSLVRDDEVDEMTAGYGHVIVDECHHLPAVSFERVLAEVRARFVVGLTATPYRRDGQQPIVHMQCGPVRYMVDPRSDAVRRPFAHHLICRQTDCEAEAVDAEAGIQGLYAALAGDETRNELILNDIIAAVDEGRSPIVLTERRDHLEYLANRLRGFARHVVVLKGGIRAGQRREALDRLALIPDHEERLVLATGRYVGEGLMTRARTPSSSLCPSRGGERSSSTPAGSADSTRRRPRCGSTTTSIIGYRCSPACSRSGYAAIECSGTDEDRR
jgi:superfamily II DNA or RNA helicase